MIPAEMRNFFRAVASVLVIFLIFFGVPVLIYSVFQRFLGMTPPSQLTQAAIYQLASLKAAETFVLVILFIMIIDRKRGKESKYAFLLAFLLFVQGGVVHELWSYLTLGSPQRYMVAGVCSSFISYALAAWFLSKLYKSTTDLIVP